MDQNIVFIYNNKCVQLFSKNFVYMVSKTDWSIEITKNYNLVLEMTIFDMKTSFPFIASLNSYPMVSIGQFQPDKMFGPLWLIQKLIY